MPHFIIECSEELLTQIKPEEILLAVYKPAQNTNLFSAKGPGGIKVRINPYKHYITSDQKSNFIHVFAHIMEGRNEEQKVDLSKKIVASLVDLVPDSPIVSISILDIEKSTYYNKAML